MKSTTLRPSEAPTRNKPPEGKCSAPTFSFKVPFASSPYLPAPPLRQPAKSPLSLAQHHSLHGIREVALAKFLAAIAIPGPFLGGSSGFAVSCLRTLSAENAVIALSYGKSARARSHARNTSVNRPSRGLS